MGRLAIAPAAPDDLAAIGEIYDHAVSEGTANCDLEGLTLAERVAWLDAHRGRYRVWVARDGDRILGWTALSPYDRRPCFRDTGSIATYVSPTARGCGVGSALRQHLVGEAARLGFHALLSRVWATNDPSIALSQKFGWNKVAHMRETVRVGDRYIDCLLFQEVLPR